MFKNSSTHCIRTYTDKRIYINLLKMVGYGRVRDMGGGNRDKKGGRKGGREEGREGRRKGKGRSGMERRGVEGGRMTRGRKEMALALWLTVVG